VAGPSTEYQVELHPELTKTHFFSISWANATLGPQVKKHGIPA
jgi:predicted component of type VI protein secretion system